LTGVPRAGRADLPRFLPESVLQGATTNQPLTWQVVDANPPVWAEFLGDQVAAEPGISAKEAMWRLFIEVAARGADRLASQLLGRGLRTAALHADRAQRDRLAAVEGFKSGRYRVLVATDVAARGLDIDGISHVVNYDVPPSPDAYVHRVGRTGRALATGIALTLVSPGEERAMRAIADRILFKG